jgi:hypothetical protein
MQSRARDRGGVPGRPARLLAACALLVAQGARAQARLVSDRGLDPQLFRPALDADGFLSTNGTQTLRAGQLGFGALLDLSSRLARVAPTDAPSVALVDSATTASLTGNVGLGHGALLGLYLPFQALSGPRTSIPGVYNDAGAKLRSTGLGALELHAKLSLRQGGLSRLGVAGLLRVELPTGKSAELRGSPGVCAWPALAVDYEPWGFLRGGVELGYRWVGGRGATLPVGGHTVRYDDQLSWGAALELSPTARWSFDFDARGAELVHSLPAAGASAVELSAGVKYRVTSLLSALASGTWGPTKGVEGAWLRATVGLNFAPGSADLDGDGYAARDDGCPTQAEDFDGFEDGDGCPERDNDRDGVPDVYDTCIDDPEDHDGVDDGDGCPARAIGDSDGDGFDDYSGAATRHRNRQ